MEKRIKEIKETCDKMEADTMQMKDREITIERAFLNYREGHDGLTMKIQVRSSISEIPMSLKSKYRPCTRKIELIYHTELDVGMGVQLTWNLGKSPCNLE